MQKYSLKALLFSICLLVISANSLFAEPADKGKERMRLIIKLKLLEELELDDATWKKFNDVFTKWDKKMDEHHKLMRKAVRTLRRAIKDEAKEKEITQKTNVILTLQKEFGENEQKRINEIKAILPPDKFAKFIVFEHTFRREIMERLFEHRKKPGPPKGNRRGKPDLDRNMDD